MTAPQKLRFTNTTPFRATGKSGSQYQIVWSRRGEEYVISVDGVEHSFANTKSEAVALANGIENEQLEVPSPTPQTFTREDYEDAAKTEDAACQRCYGQRHKLNCLARAHTTAAMLRFAAGLAVENERLKKALTNHLCPHDMADWMACAGGHFDACLVCQHDNGTEHTWLARAEKAEAALAALHAKVREVHGSLVKDGNDTARLPEDEAFCYRDAARRVDALLPPLPPAGRQAAAQPIGELETFVSKDRPRSASDSDWQDADAVARAVDVRTLGFTEPTDVLRGYRRMTAFKCTECGNLDYQGHKSGCSFAAGRQAE